MYSVPEILTEDMRMAPGADDPADAAGRLHVLAPFPVHGHIRCNSSLVSPVGNNSMPWSRRNRFAFPRSMVCSSSAT